MMFNWLFNKLYLMILNCLKNWCFFYQISVNCKLFIKSDYDNINYIEESIRATPEELRRNLEALECSLDEISSVKGATNQSSSPCKSFI